MSGTANWVTSRSVWSKSSEPASTVPARLRNSSALSGDTTGVGGCVAASVNLRRPCPAQSYVRRWWPVQARSGREPSHLARQLTQPKALHLAGEGARQIIDEVHAVGVLVAAQARPAQLAQLVGELVGSGPPGGDDERGDPARVVDRHADDADVGD